MTSPRRHCPAIPKSFIPLILCALVVIVGCSGSNKPQSIKLTTRYQTLPPKAVPVWLKDSIFERCDLTNNEPFLVSGFGLVSNLRGTGDTFAGNAVREYIRKDMVTHGFGSSVQGFDNMQPQMIFQDPRFAIVRVAAFIPPGARLHQRFDIYVSALDGNNTSNLAHGSLYRTELKVDGANVQAPGYKVDVWASGEGSIFVNPAYALMTTPTDPESRASLRQGLVMNGGVVKIARPLILRLRQPQLSMARNIQYRINQAFQNSNTSSARDEALIALYVPEKYGDDWVHFSQVVRHLFINSSPEFAAVKAAQLAAEAVKPDAPLEDISYCWEAMGPTVLPQVTPLIASEKPDVAYAAARAAAFLGDTAAQNALMSMARAVKHPFQISAVQTLAKLPASLEINHLLRTLLDTDDTLVRIEVYRALADRQDPLITSRRIVRSTGEDSFMLDMVASQGRSIIYASRTGVPRIALLGNKAQMDLPVVFTAMQNRFSISSEANRLNVFYRGAEIPKPISIVSSPDLVELVARLAGEGAPGEPRLQFNYCDVVSLLQAMSDPKRPLFSGPSGDGRTPVAFVLQEMPRIEQAIQEAPSIPDQPITAAPDQLGPAAGSRTNAADVK